MKNEISEIIPNEFDEIRVNSNLRILKFGGSQIKFAEFYNSLMLNPSQKVVMSSLLLLSEECNAITVKSFNQHLISKNITFQPNTLRRIFQELRDKCILKEEDVYHKGKLLKNCKAMVLCDQMEASAFDINLRAKKASNKRNDKRKTDLQSQRTLLSQRGLSETDKIVDNDYLPAGVMYSRGLFPEEILHMSPLKATGATKISRRYASKGGGDFHIEAKSVDQVTTQAALATGLVIVMIAIAHNNKMLTQRRFKEAFEEKEFPCSIADIIKLRGMSDGGTSRKMIRDHINWLRETIYKITDLDGVAGFEDLKRTFRTTDFQFFSQVTSNADEAPVINGTTAEVTPNLFFIRLHDSLIEELSRPESHHFFSLPWKMLSAEPLPLSLYISLRAGRVENEVMLLEDLKSRMHYEGRVDAFQEDLESDLMKADFHVDAREADFNLCGYYITKSLNQAGQTQYRIVCDTVEMINSSGATYNPSKGKQNAPTLQNPLLSKTVSELKFAAHAGHFQKSFVTPNTQRSTQIKQLMLSSGLYDVTFYDDEERCQEVAQAIQLTIGGEFSRACGLVDSLKGQLQPLGYQECIVTPELFNALVERVSDERGEDVANAMIVGRARHYRRKKVVAWISGDFDSILEDFK